MKKSLSQAINEMDHNYDREDLQIIKSREVLNKISEITLIKSSLISSKSRAQGLLPVRTAYCIICLSINPDTHLSNVGLPINRPHEMVIYLRDKYVNSEKYDNCLWLKVNSIINYCFPGIMPLVEIFVRQEKDKKNGKAI